MQDVDFPSSTPAVREASGDKDCARVLQAVLAVVMRERTTIVITHRLATAQRADRIFVLDHGRIVDAGTRAELIVRDGRYARLAALQFAA